MALDRKNLVALMKTVAKADPSAPVAYAFGDDKLSYEALNETLRSELNAYADTYRNYEANKQLIFSIIEETLDDVLPKKVADAYSQFAEVKTFAQGDKPLFRRKVSARNRAKQFITKVGLAGRYEVFKLNGTESFEVPTSAIGGAAQIGFEEFLDGRVDFAEMLDIVMEGMDELIYREVAHAMIDSIGQLPAANRISVAGYDEVAFDNLLSIASAYGEPTIYCTMEFAVKMIPAEAWRYTEAMKDELFRNGHFATYKGRRVVILPQGVEDESNTRKVLDPGYVWIIPNGGDSKPVKIAFEGATHMKESENDDWSRDIQVYKKVGVVAMMGNHICSYIDTTLKGQLDYKTYDTVAGVKSVAGWFGKTE